MLVGAAKKNKARCQDMAGDLIPYNWLLANPRFVDGTPGRMECKANDRKNGTQSKC